jgi:hypothetical protein
MGGDRKAPSAVRKANQTFGQDWPGPLKNILYLLTFQGLFRVNTSWHLLA